jgi:hypothetical protein
MSTKSAPTAVGFGDRPDRPRMRLLDFHQMRQGKLFGFARIGLTIGLRISDIPILAEERGPFAALPATPMLDQEGRQKRDLSGNPRYVAFLERRDRDLSSRFSATDRSSLRPIRRRSARRAMTAPTPLRLEEADQDKALRYRWDSESSGQRHGTPRSRP